MRPRPILLGALSAAAALLAVACSSGGGTGPLGGGGDPGTQCFPAVQGQTVAQGFYALENTGKTAATVRGVRLTNPHGVSMTTKAWVIPVLTQNGDTELVGAGFPYPPVTWPTWKQRRAAVGAVIRPGQTLNLVFGIKRTTAKTATSEAPTVTYIAGGNNYTWQDATSFVMTAKRSC